MKKRSLVIEQMGKIMKRGAGYSIAIPLFQKKNKAGVLQDSAKYR